MRTKHHRSVEFAPDDERAPGFPWVLLEDGWIADRYATEAEAVADLQEFEE